MKSAEMDPMEFHRKTEAKKMALEVVYKVSITLVGLVLAMLFINYGLPAIFGPMIRSLNANPTVQVSNARLERSAETFIRGYILDSSAPVRIGVPVGTVGISNLEAHPSMVDTSHILPEVPKGWGVLEFVDTPPITLASDLRSGLHQIDWWGVGYTQRQLQMMADAKQAYVTAKAVNGQNGPEVLVFLFYSDKAPAN